MRLNYRPEEETQVRRRLLDADSILIEFNSDNSNSYTQNSPYLRYMELAQILAVQGGKDLVIMDSMIPKDRFSIWQLAGIPLSHDQVRLASAIEIAYQIITPRIIDGTIKNSTKKDIDLEVIKILRERHGDLEVEKLSSFTDAAVRYVTISSFFNPEGVSKFVQSYHNLDCYSRDIFYHRQIKEYRHTHPTSKVAVVVGMAHMQAATEAINQQDCTLGPSQNDVVTLNDYTTTLLPFPHS